MDKSLLEIIYENTLKNPDALCVVDNSGINTYQNFWDKILMAAESLKRIGIKENDCVLVECTQDSYYLACDFACNVIGAIFVPIEHKISVEHISEIFDDTKAKLYIYKEEITCNINKKSYLEIFVESTKYSTEICFPKGENIAEILYTTGTTGKSKGIMITHANNIALAENIAYGTEMQVGNVELVPIPISHSHGLRCCYANFFKSGCVVLIEGVVQIKKVYNLMVKYHVTAMDLSPMAMSFLLRISKGKFRDFDSQLDYIQIGTAMLSEELKQELKALFPNVRLYNFYGSTESGRSCVLNFNSCDDKKYCIGRPTKNAKFMIVDSNRNPINSSEKNVGIIACAGAMNMKGYLNQKNLTNSICKEGYIFTADEGYIDSDGLIYVLGRVDDIINYKGIKIAPDEIEEIAKKYAHIMDCACVPVSDENAGQIPKLFIQPKSLSTFVKEDFITYLKEHVDANKMPKEITIIDVIPRTYNGKIKRKELIEK